MSEPVQTRALSLTWSWRQSNRLMTRGTSISGPGSRPRLFSYARNAALTSSSSGPIVMTSAGARRRGVEVDDDVGRFLAAMRVRCGPILLPPRCHEDQKA
jgi:hypothetical protein